MKPEVIKGAKYFVTSNENKYFVDVSIPYCECKGFARHKKCKHLLQVNAMIIDGLL